MAVQLGFGVGADGFRYRIEPGLLESAGCSRDDYYWCLENSLQKFYQAEDMLNMIMK
jgi:hypothetical protein